MKYIKITTAVKAQGGWTTTDTAVFISGYQISESRIFGSTSTTKNVSVQVSFSKSLADKIAGESTFQPVIDMANPLSMGVYLSDLTGTITDIKVLSSTLAYYEEKGLQATIEDDTVISEQA